MIGVNEGDVVGKSKQPVDSSKSGAAQIEYSRSGSTVNVTVQNNSGRQCTVKAKTFTPASLQFISEGTR